MTRGNGVGVLLACIILVVIPWSNWLIDLEHTKRNGSVVADAIKKYREQNNALPASLEELVPQYLKKLPRVKRSIPILSDKEFNYSVYDVIPFSGCFYLTFRHKSDGLNYKYDSRYNSIIYNMSGTVRTDYIEENITFEDIHLLSRRILSFYRDSLKYPTGLNELIPTYMKSFPYDTSARYRPYDIAPKFSAELLTYEFHQPCDTFRGKFRLSFDTVFGKYYYNTFTNDGGWAYDD
jgi:hypothetical protein